MVDVVKKVKARRIWDSRGNPTIEVDVLTSDGTLGRGRAPAGASRGKREALELRDGGNFLQGKDVTRSVNVVETLIADNVCEHPLDNLGDIDQLLLDLDESEQKANLGGNTLVAVSLAMADAIAKTKKMRLWELFASMSGSKPIIPLPEIQIFGGGAHASRRVDIQDFMVMAPGASCFAEALVMTAEIYHAAGSILKSRGNLAGVADEGGWWPEFSGNEDALETLVEAIEASGLKPGNEIVISLDIAASEFYHDHRYHLGLDRQHLQPEGWLDVLGRWIESYPIVSIEDPMAETDQEGMATFTKAFGSRLQIVGDDYLVSRSSLVEKAQTEGACNALLLKVNQVGTVSEALDAFRTAQAGGWQTIVSARSGETEDAMISHLATGIGCGQLKVGSFSRSERMAKWNECLRIEEELGSSLFAGSRPLANTWWTNQS